MREPDPFDERHPEAGVWYLAGVVVFIVGLLVWGLGIALLAMSDAGGGGTASSRTPLVVGIVVIYLGGLLVAVMMRNPRWWFVAVPLMAIWGLFVVS